MAPRLGSVRRPAVDRFADYIALTDSGCIEWLGGLNGRTSLDQTGKTYAHRWSYEYHVGPIPEGLHIDHLCRNRACVNADHLEPVTHRENLLRGVGPSALHAKKTHCPKGHPYAGDNLYTHPTKGLRYCRACGREHAAEYRAKKAS